MKSLIIMLAMVLFLSFGCITTQSNIVLQQTNDLQELVQKLKDLSKDAIETKRTISNVILSGFSYDAGAWAVALETSKVRPSAELQNAVEQLTELAFEWEALQLEGELMTDYKLGKAVAYYVIIVGGVIEFGITSVLPRVSQLLALF